MLARYCPPPHQTGRADLPASGFRHWSSLQSFSESYQSEFPEMGRQCGSFGNSPGSLATSPKVLDHPVFHVPVDLLHGGSTVPFSVIGLPSPQMPVDVSYEFGNRYVLLLIGDHFSHALSRVVATSYSAQFASTDASVRAAKGPIGSCTLGSPARFRFL